MQFVLFNFMYWIDFGSGQFRHFLLLAQSTCIICNWRGKNTDILNKKKHQSKREREEFKKRTNVQIRDKRVREEKALTQIPSLGPKPLNSHVKQIRRRGEESEIVPSLEKAYSMMIAHLNMDEAWALHKATAIFCI